METVTKCCSASVVRHHGKFYPDGNTYYINTSFPVCEKCLDEYPSTNECEEDEENE